jgi:hypothetical protein
MLALLMRANLIATQLPQCQEIEDVSPAFIGRDSGKRGIPGTPCPTLILPAPEALRLHADVCLGIALRGRASPIVTNI